MYNGYTDVQRMIGDLVEYIKADFSAPWLHKTDCTRPENIPADLSRRPDVLSHMPLDRHSDKHEICWVVDGQIHMQINHKLIEVKKREAVIILPGVYHNELALRGDKGVMLWLSSSGSDIYVSTASHGGQFAPVIGIRLQFEPIWCKLRLGDIENALLCSGGEPSDLLKCYLLENLLNVQQELKKNTRPMDGAQWRRSVVQDIVRYVRERQGQNVDMGELSGYSGLSANYLNVIFKDVTGKTVMSFLNESRISRAKELLETSSMRIKEIAELLGYYDQYHFCKVFKKMTGISPTQYRASAEK